MRVPEPGKVCRVHQKSALLDRILTGRIPRADASAADTSPAGTPDGDQG
jgi:hypothetical protein